ncbi:MAG: PaaI family thioesterase [Chloroflexi bacterium]|nr:PaaI family thioesterase [Chloroflexota bacterium]
MADLPFLPEDKESFTGCFACGRDNPIGLKLQFAWDGKTTRTEFVAEKCFQGWPGIVHGAIVMSLLDEAMSYAAFYSGFSTVTGKMSVKLKKPARIGERLTITGGITKMTRKLIETEAVVISSDGEEIARGEGTMFILNRNKYYKN